MDDNTPGDDDLMRTGTLAGAEGSDKDGDDSAKTEIIPEETENTAPGIKEENLPPAREDSNFIEKGERINLLDKDPVLREVMIGVGWDQRAFEEDPADLDISVFMLNAENETREDGDFVFYNNPVAYDGGVMHKGDSRTGAGEGDDENINIHLHSIPFDVQTVMFVLSIYDEKGEGFRFDLVKNIFIRLTNKENGHELVRYEVNEEDCNGKNVMKLAALIREGPEWYFEAVGESQLGGLGKIATDYGIIVREVQSTGYKKSKEAELEAEEKDSGQDAANNDA